MPIRPKTHAERMAATRPQRIDATPRPSPCKMGYGRTWEKLRLMVLRDQPICAHCQRAPATEVDHIIAKAKGGDNDRANLVGLCKPCHSVKTCREDGGGWKWRKKV